jgi:hypothetical protein
MSAPMVRALLSGAKTQTRRVVKPQPLGGAPTLLEHLLPHQRWATDEAEEEHVWKCPYGEPGDRLWVRETWSPDPPIDSSWASTEWNGCGRRIDGVPERFQHPRFCNYSADWLHGPIVWRPSIHMPRWASRLTLEITGVRVEMLQEISVEDCIAEGMQSRMREHDAVCDLRDQYRDLWEQINGRGSWDANPFVWVLEFRKLERQ